jgi:hypothetical protein
MGPASFFQHTVVLITYNSFFKDCSHISTGFQFRKAMVLHQYSQFWYNGSSFACMRTKILQTTQREEPTLWTSAPIVVRKHGQEITSA